MFNPDIQNERTSATISSEELSCFLYKGSENLDKKRKIESVVLNDPDFKSTPRAFLSDSECYEEDLRISCLSFQKAQSLKDLLKTDDDIKMYNLIFDQLGYPELRNLHDGMFTPIVLQQMSDVQKKKWLPLCKSTSIIGTYAQTELGHGTFLRGLETTAHYDPSTQEFVLNSPTVTSIKWWPGTMGKTATHAVVLAQLYTLGKCYGIHPFMVQLRSMDDHSSLPGITVGDIGPKFSKENDNGYLKLSNYRIPRENMFMKYAQVSPNGTYTKPPNSALTYGVMTLLRSKIVQFAYFSLAKGVTIAVRYSAVRRQSEMRPGEPEPQIISYLTQQHKLFPLLATAYAFYFTQLEMINVYNTVAAEVQSGHFANMQLLHALSSGLKAYTTWITNAGLEILRMSCGGHGYSQASGFPILYTNFTPACTYEGENTVLMLQTARFLVKCVRNNTLGENVGDTVKYLFTKPDTFSTRVFSDLDFLVNLFKQRAYNLVHFACSKVDGLVNKGKDLVTALNSSSIFLVQAATVHCHYFIVDTFVKKVNTISVSNDLRKVLKQLALLFALDGIDKNSGDFLESQIINGSEMKEIRKSIVELLPLIRTNAVALVDAFDFRDEFLHSVLGRYDGNVYENLFKWAQQSPLNKTDVHPSYHKYLGPLLKANRSKL